MLIVLTPAASSRLTTVQAVRDRFGLTDGEAADAAVERMIDVASQMAASFCNRTFGRETVQQVESPRWFASGIVLERSPAAITSVIEDGTTLVAADYHLDTARNVLSRRAEMGWASWGGCVEITYNAGWLLPGQEGANLPAIIEHAALMLVGAQLSEQNRDPLVKSETVDGLGRVDFWVPGSGNHLPDPTAESILRAYRVYSL